MGFRSPQPLQYPRYARDTKSVPLGFYPIDNSKTVSNSDTSANARNRLTTIQLLDNRILGIILSK